MDDQTRPQAEHLDRLPSLSGLPHPLLQVPLWLPPRVAAQMAAWDWTDGRWHLSMRNPLPPLTAARPQHAPGGVLRHHDLDVLLALVHQWIIQGRRPDGLVTCTLPEILLWAGHHDLGSAPYLTLRASLYRLRHSQISVWEGGAATLDGVTRATYSLLARVDTDPQTRPGQTVSTTIRLDDAVTSYMVPGLSQSIDLDVYAHLCRHPATRRIPLARVVWVALTIWRQRDSSLLPRSTGWLAARYGDRRYDIAGGGQGALVYRDALSPRSRLRRAMVALAQAGVLSWQRDQADVLHGRYMAPTSLPRLRDQPRQGRIVMLDYQAMAEAAARGADPASVPLIACDPAVAAAPAPTPPAPSAEPADLVGLLRLCPGLGRQVLPAALAAGWTDRQIAACAAWVVWSQAHGHDGAAGSTAAARLAHRLRSSDPASWAWPAVAAMVRATGHYESRAGDQLREWIRSRLDSHRQA